MIWNNENNQFYISANIIEIDGSFIINAQFVDCVYYHPMVDGNRAFVKHCQPNYLKQKQKCKQLMNQHQCQTRNNCRVMLDESKLRLIQRQLSLWRRNEHISNPIFTSIMSRPVCSDT